MIVVYLSFALALLKTFAPMVVPMLIVYRIQREDGTLGGKIFACALAVIAGLALYAVLALAIPMRMGAPPFSAASLLVAFGYAFAGALGGFVVARRLRFEARPRTFSS